MFRSQSAHYVAWGILCPQTPTSKNYSGSLVLYEIIAHGHRFKPMALAKCIALRNRLRYLLGFRLSDASTSLREEMPNLKAAKQLEESPLATQFYFLSA